MTDAAARGGRRFMVAGRVQGVFFRGSTAQQAARLGIAGWARNLPDGRVEVVALGDEDALEELGRWLRRGPPIARVEKVAVEEIDVSHHTDVTDFRTG